MANLNFYHLTSSPLGKSLPKLLEKVVISNMRALVVTENTEQMELLNKELWTYTTKFFLPHGSTNDDFISKQPILLTADNDNLNNANILAVVGKADIKNIDKFEKSLYMFDGNDSQQLNTARSHWKNFKEMGHNLIYWKQTKKGTWEKVQGS